MGEQGRQFGINRDDTAFYTMMNMGATNANAAAQRSSAQNSAYMAAAANMASSAIGAYYRM